MNQRLDNDWFQFVNLPGGPSREDIVKAVMIVGTLLVGAFVIAMAIGLVCMMVIR